MAVCWRCVYFRFDCVTFDVVGWVFRIRRVFRCMCRGGVRGGVQEWGVSGRGVFNISQGFWLLFGKETVDLGVLGITGRFRYFSYFLGVK